MSDVYAVPQMSGEVHGVVRVPGSKSITNRVLPLAALAEGSTEIRGALFSDDSRYCMQGLQQLGYRMEVSEAESRIVVQGAGTSVLQHPQRVDLFVGNSGTTARFLTALVALGQGQYRLDGVARMRERPIADLLAALQTLGCDAQSELETGCPPVLVRASGLQGGQVRISGRDSSQFITALLLAAPYAAAEIELVVEGELVSRPYVDMTVQMMRQFGALIATEDQSYRITPSHYQGRLYEVEPDASGASYFLALAAALGGAVTVTGLHLNAMQGDAQFARVLEQMGCRLEDKAAGLTVTGVQGGLQGITVDLFDMSDMVPTLAALAPLANGPVHIRNVANVRLKETDRIAACVTELRKFGVVVDEHPDGLSIYPCAQLQSGVRVATYDDHRMAMAFAILGLRVPGTEIADPTCVNKTFPGFFAQLEKLLGLL